MRMRVAAIDIGTNTARLLVAEESGGGNYRDLDRRLIFTRLGQGVDAAGAINDDAMKRTLGAIAEFSAVCGEFEVARVRVAATSAVRDASNRSMFLEAARTLTGVDSEVLTGSDEARLSYIGAVADLEPDFYLVCDIGGGSTEYVLGSSSEPGGAGGPTDIEAVSIDIGSVRLTERHLRHDPPEEEELTKLETEIDEALDVAAAGVARASEAILVGVAGTVTSLAALSLKLRTYEPHKTHLSRLTEAQVRRLYRRLALMTLDERKRLPGLPAGRADVIVAGSAILLRSMERWSFAEVIVSEKDILDGLVMEVLRSKHG